MIVLDASTPLFDILQFCGANRFLLNWLIAEPWIERQAPNDANRPGDNEGNSPGRHGGNPVECPRLVDAGLHGTDAACQCAKNERRECRAPSSRQPKHASRTSAFLNRQPTRLDARHIRVSPSLTDAE